MSTLVTVSIATFRVLEQHGSPALIGGVSLSDRPSTRASGRQRDRLAVGRDRAFDWVGDPALTGDVWIIGMNSSTVRIVTMSVRNH